MADGAEERKKLHEKTRDLLLGNVKSMSESYDRGLLTLSSAFLGGSLAFTSQVIDMNLASLKVLLYLSWACFAAAIILTLASFAYTMLTLQSQLDAAERYYDHQDEGARSVATKVHQVTLRFVVLCGVSFVAGILLLGSFISINVFREATVTQTPKYDEHSIPPGSFQRPAAPAQPQQPAPPPSAPQKGK
jgi:hypothetical protein